MVKMNLEETVYFRREGFFYSVYNDDAYIVSYIMDYKLVKLNDDEVKTGFPIDLLEHVINYLRRNHVSYCTSDRPEKHFDFGKENRYHKMIKRDLPVASSMTEQNKKKRYTGSFSIIFDDESDEESYIIGENISSDAEIVKLVYENETGKIVSLSSGEKFQIISKNIEEK